MDDLHAPVYDVICRYPANRGIQGSWGSLMLGGVAPAGMAVSARYLDLFSINRDVNAIRRSGMVHPK